MLDLPTAAGGANAVAGQGGNETGRGPDGVELARGCQRLPDPVPSSFSLSLLRHALEFASTGPRKHTACGEMAKDWTLSCAV